MNAKGKQTIFFTTNLLILSEICNVLNALYSLTTTLWLVHQPPDIPTNIVEEPGYRRKIEVRDGVIDGAVDGKALKGKVTSGLALSA